LSTATNVQIAPHADVHSRGAKKKKKKTFNCADQNDFGFKVRYCHENPDSYSTLSTNKLTAFVTEKKKHTIVSTNNQPTNPTVH
jgi:hypothetical protein